MQNFNYSLCFTAIATYHSSAHGQSSVLSPVEAFFGQVLLMGEGLCAVFPPSHVKEIRRGQPRAGRQDQLEFPPQSPRVQHQSPLNFFLQPRALRPHQAELDTCN